MKKIRIESIRTSKKAGKRLLAKTKVNNKYVQCNTWSDGKEKAFPF